MKHISIFTLLLFICTCLSAQKVNPVVKNFGGVTPIPYAVEKPDTKLNYKVLVEVNTDNAKPEIVHELLEKTAAAVNLHALGGVTPDKLNVVLVIHGPAAQFIVNNTAYKQKYGIDNPNLPLFTDLEKAGVKMFVCGQSLEKRKIDPATIAPEVKVALSAITTLTTYQLKGYTLLKF